MGLLIPPDAATAWLYTIPPIWSLDGFSFRTAVSWSGLAVHFAIRAAVCAAAHEHEFACKLGTGVASSIRIRYDSRPAMEKIYFDAVLLILGFLLLETLEAAGETPWLAALDS